MIGISNPESALFTSNEVSQTIRPATKKWLAYAHYQRKAQPRIHTINKLKLFNSIFSKALCVEKGFSVVETATPQYTHSVCEGLAVGANAIKNGKFILSGLVNLPSKHKVKDIFRDFLIQMTSIAGAQVELVIVGGAKSTRISNEICQRIKKVLLQPEFAECVSIKAMKINPWAINPRLKNSPKIAKRMQAYAVSLSCGMYNGNFIVVDKSSLPKLHKKDAFGNYALLQKRLKY